MTELKTFWEDTHELTELYRKYDNELVPRYGVCKTHAGECLRAATKICYDFYNNGFGNNWSGPFNYLMDYGQVDLSMPQQIVLDRYARGRVCINDEPETVYTLEVLVNLLVECVVLNIQNGVYGTALPFCDMYDLTEKEDKNNDD